MIIVNQNGTNAVNFDNVFSIFIDIDHTKKTIYATSKISRVTVVKLAEYETEERTKEVWKDMWQRQIAHDTIYHMPKN